MPYRKMDKRHKPRVNLDEIQKTHEYRVTYNKRNANKSHTEIGLLTYWILKNPSEWSRAVVGKEGAGAGQVRTRRPLWG